MGVVQEGRSHRAPRRPPHHDLLRVAERRGLVDRGFDEAGGASLDAHVAGWEAEVVAGEDLRAVVAVAQPKTLVFQQQS